MVANIVLLFGYQLAGPLGGILSAVGLCVPAVVVMTVVTAIYDLIKNNYWVFAALKGVQCAVVPIIGSAAISLSKEALKDKIAIRALPRCSLHLPVYVHQQSGAGDRRCRAGPCLDGGERA